MMLRRWPYYPSSITTATVQKHVDPDINRASNAGDSTKRSLMA
jgi:hypothetical protein